MQRRFSLFRNAVKLRVAKTSITTMLAAFDDVRSTSVMN